MSFLTYNQLKKLLVLVEDNENNQGEGNADLRKQYMLDISHKELRKIPLQIPSNEFVITDIEASYNYFKDLYHLNNQPNPNLYYLNLSFNFLVSSCFQGFGRNFISLKVLDLNANRIQSVSLNDDDFPQLEALYLKNNRIKFFMRCPQNLNILCLDHNQLEKLVFQGGKSLQILSASSNKIQQFEIEYPQTLNFLDLEDNLIGDMPAFESFLKKSQNLLSLNTIGNYISKVGHKKYLITVLTLCPKIVKIDEIIINPHVREAFKTLKQEENLQKMLTETHEAYQNRMKQQLELKQQMLDKLDAERQKISNDFSQYLKNQKKHLEALEQYAKNNMGARKLNIANENKGMSNVVNEYLGEELKLTQNQDPSNEVQSNLVSEHKRQYDQYRRNQDDSQTQRHTSQLRRYFNQEKNQGEIDSEIDEELEDLEPQEKERRRRNMRNPTLIYRNSNELMINRQELLRQLNNASPLQKGKSDMASNIPVLNPKCFPYLLKQYGFHTIV